VFPFEGATPVPNFDFVIPESWLNDFLLLFDPRVPRCVDEPLLEFGLEGRREEKRGEERGNLRFGSFKTRFERTTKTSCGISSNPISTASAPLNSYDRLSRGFEKEEEERRKMKVFD
jgi:hypothetical protein